MLPGCRRRNTATRSAADETFTHKIRFGYRFDGIGFLSDGLVLVGVSSFWQVFIKGAVIVLAVMLDQLQERLQSARAASAAAASVRKEKDIATPSP